MNRAGVFNFWSLIDNNYETLGVIGLIIGLILLLVAWTTKGKFGQDKTTVETELTAPQTQRNIVFWAAILCILGGLGSYLFGAFFYVEKVTVVCQFADGGSSKLSDLEGVKVEILDCSGCVEITGKDGTCQIKIPKNLESRRYRASKEGYSTITGTFEMDKLKIENQLNPKK